MKKILPIICGLALALVGCASPKLMDCGTVSQLHEGTATYQDALALLAKNPDTTSISNGQTMYLWNFISGNHGTSVMLTFGPDGKLFMKNCTMVNN